MLQLLSGNPRTVDALGFLLAFALTALMDSVFHDKLPHDHGRAFAVNGELSKGKARGSGLIFVLCIALVTLAVVPFKAEYVIYTVLLIASMLSGYFDDADGSCSFCTDVAHHGSVDVSHGSDHQLLQNGGDAQRQSHLGRLAGGDGLTLPHPGRKLFK